MSVKRFTHICDDPLVLASDYDALEARLIEAKAIIVELCGHEGAEGWSDYLSARIDRFFTSEATHE